LPQRGQNAKSPSQTKPHPAQARDSFRPQRGQKAKSDEAGAPQPAQVI
jgi:hypothetical protein